jgi:RNA polymerase sigma-70 factor (ECF subfamily)
LHARICAGDGEALRVVWDNYAPLVRALLRRAFGPGDELEDALHDVFVRLLESVGQVRDGAALRSYIVTIALNTARAERRRRRVRRAAGVEGEHAVTDANEPSHMTLPAETETHLAIARLERILSAVPEDERDVLLLRYVEERELTEVAAVSGISLATVKRKLSKASSRIIARAKRDVILAELLDIHAPPS